MNKHPIWDNFFTKAGNKSIVSFLKSIALFEDLKHHEIVRLERTLHKRYFKKDEVIIREGEPGAAMYVVKEGKVNVFIHYDTQPILLTSLETGMFFGELALFDENPRSATIAAEKDTILIALSKADFEVFSQKEPSIGYKIVMRLGSIVSKRLRVANDQIETQRNQNEN